MSTVASAPAIPPRTAASAGRPIAMPVGGMAGLTMQGTPSLRLPGEHFAAALFFLGVGSIGLIWIAPELAAGLYLSPHVAGVTHCFTLGWLSMTIFGALYQLLPVALGVSIRSERAGHFSFWTFVPGVALFASGVAFSSVDLRYVGIGLITISIVCLLINVGMSLQRVAKRDVIWAAVTTGISFLGATLLLGALLAENMRVGFLGEARIRVLTTHLHVAMLGWVLIMIMGISHRLLPMFLLAHTAGTQWTRRALTFVAPGVVILGCGLATNHRIAGVSISWVGVILVEAGIVCFLRQAWLFFVARKRPRLDAGLRHAAVALIFLGCAAILAPIVMLSGMDARQLDTGYVLIGLLGGLTLYVVGQFYKVVPFLAWMARFHDDMGKRRVPTVAQLYSSRIAHVDLLLFVLGIGGMFGGVLAGISTIVRVGAWLFAFGVALFVSQIIRVAFGTSFGVATPAPSIPPARAVA
ncbi:MAG: hypothetical protein ABI035_06765 [Gemmatimonadaceae bacterium]